MKVQRKWDKTLKSESGNLRLISVKWGHQKSDIGSLRIELNVRDFFVFVGIGTTCLLNFAFPTPDVYPADTCPFAPLAIPTRAVLWDFNFCVLFWSYNWYFTCLDNKHNSFNLAFILKKVYIKLWNWLLWTKDYIIH